MSKKIHDILQVDRQREKLLHKGAKALSDQEVLILHVGPALGIICIGIQRGPL